MRILFITATRVGDAVLSTGLLDHLIRENPDARVTVACGPMAAPLFEAVPNLERIIVLEKQAFSLHWVRLWAACVG
ncbi:MAG: glycosyltransferase family 9 protein, partial [Alphaproteobacteria bacterium]|nr:glycosyltransferase family 9 protein [Alphaproteobacteria bacterium]